MNDRAPATLGDPKALAARPRDAGHFGPDLGAEGRRWDRVELRLVLLGTVMLGALAWRAWSPW